MKTNITLKLDSELLKEAKVMAARDGTSVSQMMTDLLEQRVRQDMDYEQARRRAVARLENPPNLGWTPPASRDELYDR